MKRLGLLLAATFTIAALAPAAASAGEGTISMNGSEPCNVAYTYGGSIPGSGALSGFESETCDFDIGLVVPMTVTNTSSISATFTGTPGSGSVSISGIIRISFGTAPFVFDCRYSTTSMPTGSYVADSFSTTSGTAAKISGGGLCPSALTQVEIEGSLP